jgi:hypothetical protein
VSAAVRQALADAANTVAGVDVVPYFRQAYEPGQGSVRLDRVEYPNRFGGVAYWWVIVAVGSDLADAEAKADTLAPALVAAIDAANVMVVQAARHTQVTLPDGSGVPAVVIEGFRESE